MECQERKISMDEFDRLILEQFTKRLERRGTDMHDHKALLIEARIFVDMITDNVFDFVQWSIEDDRNKRFDEIINSIDAGMHQ